MTSPRERPLIGIERVVFFTDALVAIAATLLILPLVDAASAYTVEQKARHEVATAADFLSQQSDGLLAFAISFAVIARLWFAHHRLFEHVRSGDAVLAALTLVWAFTIVFLPLPTQMSAQFPSQDGISDRGTMLLYIGTMLASSLLLTAVVLWVRAHPRLREGRDAPLLAPSVATSALFALALAVCLATGKYYGMLLLLLSGVAESLLRSRLDRTVPPADAKD